MLSVGLSFGLSAVCWVCCLYVGIESLGFSEFQHGIKRPYQVVHARFFGKTFFAPKNMGSGPKIGQK